jgi:hypothetical protein
MVDVSPGPKTKSRTLSDVFGSAEVSSSATAASLLRRSINGPSSMSRGLSPTVAEVLSAGARRPLPLVGIVGYRQAQRVLERGLNVCTRALSSVRR